MTLAVTTPAFTSSGIAYDRAGPGSGMPVVLIHAGVADRRMWDPIWAGLTAQRDAIRLDLRGFGDSVSRRTGRGSPASDVLEMLSHAGVLPDPDVPAEQGAGQCHLAGASFGAGVAVETVLARPGTAVSLLLAAPAGALLAEPTPDLRAFFDAEGRALERGDLDAAVEANLSWWAEGRQRLPGQVDPALRDLVRRMQRRAFELTADWDDSADEEPDPPALDRLGEISVPALVLAGGLDLDTVDDAARRVTAGIKNSRRVDWPDAGHLLSLERPADFLALLLDWLAETEASAGA
jgi:3-oxoadipate enol-lactonase